jgi:hypothetical protein
MAIEAAPVPSFVEGCDGAGFGVVEGVCALSGLAVCWAERPAPNKAVAAASNRKLFHAFPRQQVRQEV